MIPISFSLQFGPTRVFIAVLTTLCAMAVSPSQAQTNPVYALSVSGSGNHGNAVALQGGTISGAAYIFTSLLSNLQNYDPSGINKVCYWLDNVAMTGTAIHCESLMPYDYVGSVDNTVASLAKPWDTTKVANGNHTITQLVTLSAGGNEVDTAGFTVNNGMTLAAPSNLQATAGNAQITLAWSGAGGATAYNVKRSTIAGGPYTTIAANVTSTGYTDTTVTNGTSYYYVVSAVNSAGESTNSNQVSATPTASIGSNPVYALSVSRSGNHGNAVALQGGTISGAAYIFTSLLSNLQNYDPSGINKVCYWLDNVAMSGTAIHCESLMPYDYVGSVDNTVASLAKPWDTTKVANGNHTITQLVTLSAGGNEVDTAGFTVNNGMTLAAPSNLQATAGNAQITLAWSGAGGATAYNVKRSTIAGGPYTTIAAHVTSTGYTDTTVTNGTSYYYVVSAVNSAGESSNSNQVSATPTASIGTIDVTSYGATGDGTTDDTAAINSAISALQPGYELYFPCGTYRVSSALKPIVVQNVTVAGTSGCTTLKGSGSGYSILQVGADSLTAATPLTAAAGELSTTFSANFSSLGGLAAGDYVVLQEGGKDYSSDTAPGHDSNCDVSGCRGEVVQIQSVSGSTATVTTALHYPYDPLGNAAKVAKIPNPVHGAVVKDLVLDGSGTVSLGLYMVGVVNATVANVSATNFVNWGLLSHWAFNLRGTTSQLAMPATVGPTPSCCMDKAAA